MDDKQRLENAVNKINSLEIRVAVVEATIKEVKEDIDSIKDNTTWILRLVVGGIIGAVITFLLNGGLGL